MSLLKLYLTKTLVISILTSVFVFLFFKFFVIDVARIDSLSMAPTLKPNSLVFVKPVSFLSSEIECNDIVQIKLPFTKNDSLFPKGFSFKRIVALPGDTINIRQSVIYVNGERLEINEDLLHNYVVKLNRQKDTVLFTDEKITEKYLIDDSCVYLVTLTSMHFTEIKNKGVSIKENKEDSALYDDNIFPNSTHIKWNKDFFGPLYIPKKSDTLWLDTSNLVLYKRIISVIENNELEIKEGKIFINQKEANYYVAKQNYYFVIGDNFDNSIDSRNWGFIPHVSIQAKLKL